MRNKDLLYAVLRHSAYAVLKGTEEGLNDECLLKKPKENLLKFWRNKGKKQQPCKPYVRKHVKIKENPISFPSTFSLVIKIIP